eukprot:GHVT01035373.1.p1 GENE.GHVT01035373.1~~GHVT01035373.1.p1  ORF type:complete len:827 (-),score=144.46 GHVT01035373.1:1580-4060(-)
MPSHGSDGHGLEAEGGRPLSCHPLPSLALPTLGGDRNLPALPAAHPSSSSKKPPALPVPPKTPISAPADSSPPTYSLSLATAGSLGAKAANPRHRNQTPAIDRSNYQKKMTEAARLQLAKATAHCSLKSPTHATGGAMGAKPSPLRQQHDGVNAIDRSTVVSNARRTSHPIPKRAARGSGASSPVALLNDAAHKSEATAGPFLPGGDRSAPSQSRDRTASGDRHAFPIGCDTEWPPGSKIWRSPLCSSEAAGVVDVNAVRSRAVDAKQPGEATGGAVRPPSQQGNTQGASPPNVPGGVRRSYRHSAVASSRKSEGSLAHAKDAGETVTGPPRVRTAGKQARAGSYGRRNFEACFGAVASTTSSIATAAAGQHDLEVGRTQALMKQRGASLVATSPNVPPAMLKGKGNVTVGGDRTLGNAPPPPIVRTAVGISREASCATHTSSRPHACKDATAVDTNFRAAVWAAVAKQILSAATAHALDALCPPAIDPLPSNLPLARERRLRRADSVGLARRSVVIRRALSPQASTKFADSSLTAKRKNSSSSAIVDLSSDVASNVFSESSENFTPASCSLRSVARAPLSGPHIPVSATHSLGCAPQDASSCSRGHHEALSIASMGRPGASHLQPSTSAVSRPVTTLASCRLVRRSSLGARLSAGDCPRVGRSAVEPLHGVVLDPSPRASGHCPQSKRRQPCGTALRTHARRSMPSATKADIEGSHTSSARRLSEVSTGDSAAVEIARRQCEAPTATCASPVAAVTGDSCAVDASAAPGAPVAGGVKAAQRFRATSSPSLARHVYGKSGSPFFFRGLTSVDLQPVLQQRRLGKPH